MCKSVGVVCCALNFFAVFCLLAGLDASAQTTSHELTIPNDVSKNRGCAPLSTLGKKRSSGTKILKTVKSQIKTDGD